MRKESLAERCELIQATVTRIVNGQVEIWMDEEKFRLPGWDQAPIFPSEPPEGALFEAYETGIPYASRNQKTLIAFPIRNDGVCIGALQVSRPEKPFRKKEIEILEGLVGHVSLSLVAAHRFAVDQWRIEQLTLVRKVSSQIANVLDLDVLTRRITKLIQRTFKYYYVAVFTHEAGQKYLQFRSSAGRSRGRGKPLKIRLGDGLIGSVAQNGEEAVTNDVRTEPRLSFLTSCRRPSLKLSFR